MTTQDLFKLIENQNMIIENLTRIVEKHEHWLHGDHKDIEKLQDKVDELEEKLIAENKSNLKELFESMNPNQEL